MNAPPVTPPAPHPGRRISHRHIAIYIDLLFCLVIMPMAIMLLPVDRWLEHNTMFLIALVAYVYGLYFTYRHFKLPRLIMERRYGRAVLLLMILIGLTVALTHFPPPPGVTRPRTAMRTQTIWFFFLMVTGFSQAIELTFELFRQIFSRQAAEAEKDKARLALYKAQINPHFLFNTLNTLYALVISGSDKTESAFIQFSNILRYTYAQSGSELIPAGDEFDYIRHYVDLQKLRLNRHTQVELTLECDDRNALIPPMILITFIENAFKYGTSSDTDCRIRLYISLLCHNLTLRTENRIMRRRPDTAPPGIGLANCTARLNLLYPGRYTLSAQEETGGFFRTHLHIQLTP